MVDTGRGSWKRALWGEQEIGLPMLFFVLLGGPVAWTLHFLIGYFFVALFCTAGWQGAGLAIGLVTVATAGISIASGVVAFRKWRERRETRKWEEAVTEGGQVNFFLVVGMLGAAFFTALIVLEALPPLFVPICSEIVG